MTKKSVNSPKVPKKIPFPSTSKATRISNIDVPAEAQEEKWTRRCGRYMYNREQRTFCGRNCKSWMSIITYSIMYLIFLSTFTMIFLYFSLIIIKYSEDFQMIDKTEFFTYAENGIGLSATPTSVHNQPLIWYRDDPSNYQKYVDSLDGLLKRRLKRDVTEHNNLGPCGSPPYGYGIKPCVVIRINKQFNWSGKPLEPNSTDVKHVPLQVKKWVDLKIQKLWLHCHGYNPYDEEHIGAIKYYPDPPGFNSDLFPIDMKSDSPLVAVQISDFTLGISLTVQCNLWYEGGVSSINFILYVTPKKKTISDL